jgi:hypothetical protein
VTRLNTGGLDQEVTSYLGTPVFADLTLKADENDAGLNIQTVLFEVDQQRNIVTTTVQGRNGTVKEYISDGDYAVSLRGLLVDPDPYTYPAQQMQELMDRLRLPQSLVAVSGFLQLFQIYNLVITGYRFFQIEGFQNVQAFELQCISDTPVELIEEDA